uniref:Ig-like domain-containing protein n=1 Tax=Oryzias latipes TaxID=8090 RepID=A0A3B3HQ35_ORYLA
MFVCKIFTDKSKHVCDDFSVTAAQNEEGWKLKHDETEICRNKGSTVYIWYSYDYPAEINGVRTTVEKSFWFIRTAAEPVDLKEDPKYKDRVTYSRNGKNCYLQISEVRESDSGVYKSVLHPHIFPMLPSISPKNHLLLFFSDPPQTASVSWITPGEILEGSSVTLTCSCDANSAANYTWFKERNSKVLSVGPQFVFSSIQSTDSGEYYCKAENHFSKLSPFYPDAPQILSVSVNPPEILKGSSVTLTCSSDANPAASFTWLKENKDSLKSEEQIFTISDITAEDGGLYICVAQNKLGQQNSTVQVSVGSGKLIMSST